MKDEKAIFERHIKKIINGNKIEHFAKSLVVPFDKLQDYKRTGFKVIEGREFQGLPNFYFPAAHEYQRLITYPFEKETLFEKFKNAFYYLYFAGNKGGKTVWGVDWVGMECLGIHPLQELGIRPKPPLHWWVVSPNLPSESEVPRGEDAPILKKFYEWIPELNDGYGWGIKKFYRKDKLMTITDKQGNDSVVNFKSHDQEKGKFKSEDVDGIYWDEEPPRSLWDEGIPRLLTKHGVFLLAMTPDYGSWTFQLLKHHTDPNYYIVEMDSLENPYMPEAFRKNVLETMSEDQQMMRRKGRHIQLKGKVFPFEYNLHVGKPFIVDANCTIIVVIDWHPAKPIMMTFLAINPKNIWYVFRESVIESHVVEAVAKEYFNKLIFPDCTLKARKNIIDKIAQIQQIQEGAFHPKSIVDMLRKFGINCEIGKTEFESAHAFISRKLNYKELWFDPICKNHIDQFDTWGAKRYQKGNLEGTIRDLLETEGNDTCMNLVYAYNSGAKWVNPFETEIEYPAEIPRRAATNRLYGRR